MNILGFYDLKSKSSSKTFQVEIISPTEAIGKSGALSNGTYAGI